MALNLPEDAKRIIKGKVFGELDVLNSKNSMGIRFEELDNYLLVDGLMNSWNKFEKLKNLRGNMGRY